MLSIEVEGTSGDALVQPLLKQGQLEQVAQACVQLGFEEIHVSDEEAKGWRTELLFPGPDPGRSAVS